MTDLNPYLTTNIALASFLKCAGYKVTTRMRRGRQAEFSIPVQQQVVNSFIDGETLVEPNRYHTAVRALTNEIKTLQRN